MTYVFERDGHVTLPTATQPWWDLGSSELKVARGSGVTVDIAASPSNTATAPVPALLWPLLAAAGTVLLVILGVVLRHLTRQRSETAAHAERSAFAALRHACTNTDARGIYQAFIRWRLYLDPARRKRATDSAASLDAAVFASGVAAWTIANSRALVSRLAVLRRTPAVVLQQASLPPLNPKGEPTSNNPALQNI